MKLLVTGSAGFIGYHAIKKLFSEYDEIIGVDNFNNYYDVDLKSKRWDLSKYFHIAHGTDIKNEVTLSSIFIDYHPDHVLHLAAQAGVRYSIENPQSYIDNNITGFLNILDCCKKYGVKKLVYASSSSVYENKSMYSVSKKANELMAEVYSNLYDIDITGLRFFTVYGEYGRPDMAYWKFTDSILSGKPIDIYNNGNMTRDFTYVDDITDGIKYVLKNDNLGHIFDLGCSNPVNIMDFIKIIEKEVGKEAIKNFMPMQAGDVQNTRANNPEWFKPKTDIETGLKIFVEWFRKYKKII